jgi:hypothetical protein
MTSPIDRMRLLVRDYEHDLSPPHSAAFNFRQLHARHMDYRRSPAIDLNQLRFSA